MKISVFIADDHTVVRDGLRAFLEAHPSICVVGGAASGRLAVNQVETLQPNIVILDINMPDLNGIDAAQYILEAAPKTGIIILSMIGSPEHIFRALQTGARGYLLKESAGREVVDAILAVNDGKYYLSQPVLKTLIADYLQNRHDSTNPDPLHVLSHREREILGWVVKGKTSAEIAELLFLSPKTVESYRSRMMQKLGMPDLAALIRFALEKGLA